MTEDHVHVWDQRQPCGCGEPVPGYLLAVWDRYAETHPAPEGGS